MNLKGLGVTQNYSRSYFWALASKLYGEKKSVLIIRKSQYKISKEEKSELEKNLRNTLKIFLKKEVFMHFYHLQNGTYQFKKNLTIIIVINGYLLLQHLI